MQVFPTSNTARGFWKALFTVGMLAAVGSAITLAAGMPRPGLTLFLDPCLVTIAALAGGLVGAIGANQKIALRAALVGAAILGGPFMVLVLLAIAGAEKISLTNVLLGLLAAILIGVIGGAIGCPRTPRQDVP